MLEEKKKAFALKLFNSSDLERNLIQKHPKYINSLDLGGIYSTSYLKNIKYCLKCKNPPMTRQKTFFKDLKLHNQKILLEFPYIPEDLSCQERLSFYNTKNLLLQLNKSKEWKDLNSKRNFQSIVFTAVEPTIKNHSEKDQLMLANIVSQKLYRFEKKLSSAKKLKDFSYVGFFDANFIRIMNSLNKIPTFKNLKIQFCGETPSLDCSTLQYSAYKMLTELEVRTTGKVFALSHLDDNCHYLENLETLSVRVHDILEPENLAPLDKFVNFQNLKNYNLFLSPMDHETIIGYLKNLSIPKNVERIRFNFTQTSPWKEAVDYLQQDKELKSHFLQAWSGLTKLKEMYILTEAEEINRRAHIRLALIMMNMFPSIETLSILLVCRNEEKAEQLTGDVIDYIDLNLAFQYFLPILPTMRTFNLISPCMSIEYFNPKSWPLENIENLTLTNIRGAKALLHFYNCIQKKKNFKLVMTNVLVQSNEELEQVFYALEGMCVNFIGSIDFNVLEGTSQDLLKDGILNLRSNLKKPSRIFVKFKIPEMSRESLNEIGQRCFKMFEKLEIETSRYYLNIQQGNFMYHLVNISMQSETTSSTDSDF